MLLGPLIFYLACYLCFGAIIYVQEVQLTTKKKQTMLKQPQLKTSFHLLSLQNQCLFFKKQNQLEMGQ